MYVPPATLLIVSADVTVQDCLHAAVGADGHNPVVATDIDSALHLLDTQDFDLILVATPNLPGENRWHEVEQLRLAAGVTPVVLLSESGAVPFAGYRERGFAGLVTTPCDPDDLSTLLRPLLVAA